MPPSPFWRHTLPIVAVTSATWPLCWWFLPDQGPQHWRRSYSSECWGWCRDSADGSAQGVVDGGSRLPMTQSHTAGWWVRRLDRALLQMLVVPYSFEELAESAVCLGQSVVYFSVNLGVWCDGTPQISELMNTMSVVPCCLWTHTGFLVDSLQRWWVSICLGVHEQGFFPRMESRVIPS